MFRGLERFQKLVVKPDQLIKRRGKLGLIKVNADFATVKSWVGERMGKDQKIGRATGKLRNFIIEPFIPHKENIVRNGNIKIGDLSFEGVEKFKYLGATVTNINDTREEIKRRINMGNACYYSVEKLLSSSLLSKNLKVRIYKTVILPVVLYGCETWTITLREEHRLRVFENKVLRKIFGAKRDEVTGEWRKLHNAELHALYSSPDIIRNIKSRRLKWAGHVARMGESRNAYRVLVGRPEGKRPLGRPRRRWEDNIKMDLREVGYDDRDWINLAQNRDRWWAYVRAAMNLRDEEAYVCIYSHRYADTILFHHQGGVDIGDVDAKALKLEIPVGQTVDAATIQAKLLTNVVAAKKPMIAKFIEALYQLYSELYFTYLEINPLVVTKDTIYILDLAAKLDSTADFVCRPKWGEIDYPPPFGRDAYPEEAYIADLDAKSGASLKLTILNKSGRIWTMVAGGGASVIYSDTICDLGGASELANYGEYSGAPSEQQTYEYAKTILGLMTQEKHPKGKVLIIGGGIANFTNVAATFKGIVTALQEFQSKLVEHSISIFVRRAGPNYQEGLRIMREVGQNLGIPLFVFGPETHMTAIVGMALGKKPIPKETEMEFATANFLLPGGQSRDSPLQSRKGSTSSSSLTTSVLKEAANAASKAARGDTKSSSDVLFTNKTKAIVWGMQTRAVQKAAPTRKTLLLWVKKAFTTGSVCDAQRSGKPSTRLEHCTNVEQSIQQSPVKSTQKHGAELGVPESAMRKHMKLDLKLKCWHSLNVNELSDGDLKRCVDTCGRMLQQFPAVIQQAKSMLDFDFVCRRSEPSVVAMVYPFTGDHKQKFYWGHKEILIPVYKKMEDAMTKHREADVVVNFASLRSAYESTIEAMNYPQIRTIAIIAEGIPENMTRKLILLAQEKNVNIIGPATVGGIKPGCFKIGNTGGMMDNILHSKLYRSGSVAYVSRSGGMSNELNNIISKATNGVLEGVAIGGDRYPGTNFMDHIMRYQADPKVKMIVLLGEVGGVEEYDVCEALTSGRIDKPLVAWCIGTCAGMFTSEVQFGHAGSCANSDRETALSKNKSLGEAGAHVPQSFDSLGDIIHEVYDGLVQSGVIMPEPEVPPPTVPMDYSWARELGLIRKPASFMTSICDERGQELNYAGMPISDVLKRDVGIGGVVSLLWFQRCLPPYVCKFFEMCLMVTADHGPAVSGAHNTIVCARAGKDLVSSVVSGLLTIGDRFGGALDGAARQFSEAYDSGLHPMEFVNAMRKKGQLIMGIGHRVKSINNPDMRVKIIKEFVLESFPAHPLLNYALEVEKITTSKKPNLILNVDGVIAVSFVDLLRHSGSFTREEAQEYIEMGSINSLFVLGRSIGFIGHFMDQKRLKQGLYRHPWDDISYVLPEQYTN
ncbi:hypothetical protein ANN_08374 [Periplaneta americana]|uniref:ATP citrate synthase n=2 Tax=Arthropoda TaxID=6656 RepID=A0ABQ8T3H1_PERAM|nr:hypothetical protein ANN_08374 [Periplaneta americana]